MFLYFSDAVLPLLIASTWLIVNLLEHSYLPDCTDAKMHLLFAIKLL